MTDVPYQQDSLVDQLTTELANATSLGITERVRACEKQLNGLGVVTAAQAAEKRAAAAADSDEARKTLPHGRSARSQVTAAE